MQTTPVTFPFDCHHHPGMPTSLSGWSLQSSGACHRLSSPLTPRVGSASKTNDDRRKRSASLGSSLTSAVGREQVSDDRLEDLVWNTHCFAAGPGKKEGRGPGGPRTPCYLQPAMINCGRSSSAAVFVLQAGGCLHCWHPSCGGVDPGGSC